MIAMMPLSIAEQQTMTHTSWTVSATWTSLGRWAQWAARPVTPVLHIMIVHARVAQSRGAMSTRTSTTLVARPTHDFNQRGSSRMLPAAMSAPPRPLPSTVVQEA